MAVAMEKGNVSSFGNLPWVEKYRPQTLDEVISHKSIVQTIDTFIARNALPHLLFYGPPGTGKTTTILACARKLYTPGEMSSMVLELNASDDRGIGVVREQIISFASSRTLASAAQASSAKKFKLVILDEADAMTRDAQNALRRVIEKYTDNVRFCIICNYLSKIIPALQSRCTRFRFAPLDAKQIKPRLRYVCESEGVEITPDGEEALIELAEGDMRRVLNVLHATATTLKRVDSHNVYQCTGRPLPSDVNTAWHSLMNDNSAACYQKLRSMQVDRGIAIADLITALHEMALRAQLSSPIQCALESQMATIERRLANGCSEKIQLGALIAAFIFARSMAHAEKTSKMQH